jgi:hypothetical protein
MRRIFDTPTTPRKKRDTNFTNYHEFSGRVFQFVKISEIRVCLFFSSLRFHKRSYEGENKRAARISPSGCVFIPHFALRIPHPKRVTFLRTLSF